jgi:hypothetical protein
MTVPKHVMPELVKCAKAEIAWKGDKSALENFNPYFGACGCMGAREGEYLCHCSQMRELKDNLVEVVAEIDEEMAKRIMIRRIIAALPG